MGTCGNGVVGGTGVVEGGTGVWGTGVVQGDWCSWGRELV